MSHQAPLTQPEAAVAPAPPLGRLQDVGGRKLMVHRSGTGGPAVVFLPGAGLVGLHYLNVHDRIAEVTTSVLYDRAGTGWSEPVALPRTAAAVTDELRDLLRAAGVPAPYVLVGHSLGGAYARHYAQRFPDEVAGLLLLDPFHEDLLDHVPQQLQERQEQLNSQDLPDLTADQLQQFRAALTQLLAKWPDPVRRPLLEHQLAAWRTGWYEGRNLHGEVADEIRRGPALPDVPMIVLTALGYDVTQAHLCSEEEIRAINAAKHDLHAQLAASAGRGEHRVLNDAGHGFLHEDRPDAVLQAISELLGEAGS
ncbi:alpha/beta hydrolase [Streptomyces sp. NPDC048637]|uniref:alpha/beta fold hydrolase n=1 Tax=Streptomyces sp. NPDC048637 TaxID=3155636 RepID=UPI0034179C49